MLRRKLGLFELPLRARLVMNSAKHLELQKMMSEQIALLKQTQHKIEQIPQMQQFVLDARTSFMQLVPQCHGEERAKLQKELEDADHALGVIEQQKEIQAISQISIKSEMERLVAAIKEECNPTIRR